MSSFLFASPIVVALIGVAIGYYFKRFVLSWLTVVVGFVMALAVIETVGASSNGFGDIILVGIIAQGLTLVIPMWITHFVKRVGGITACLKWLKSATVDTEKKAD